MLRDFGHDTQFKVAAVHLCSGVETKQLVKLMLNVMLISAVVSYCYLPELGYRI